MNDVFFDLVASRRSIREFLPDPIPQDVLDRCLDAARLAASTSNLQPWEFVVLRSPDARARANEVCFNQRGTASAPLLVAVVAHLDTWQRTSRFILDTLKERGILRASQTEYWDRHVPLIYTWGPWGLWGLAKKAFCRLRSLSRPTHNLMDKSDVRAMIHKSTALAAATFMLALRAEGYDSCPMEGFDPWRAKGLLGLGRRAEVSMFLAIGKRGPKAIWWERILVPRDWSVREL
jgi:nitroreductase